MKRSEREITDINLLHTIILKSKVCRIAMCLNDIPYIIPVHFGFKDNIIYIHSSKKGKKIEILTHNENVCIEMNLFYEIIESKIPCKWSTKYQSVICYGVAEFIENYNDKREALKIIMDHYSSDKNYEFNKGLIDNLRIIKIKLDKIIGKQCFDKS